MTTKYLTIKDREAPQNLKHEPEITNRSSLVQRGFIVVNKSGGLTSHDVVDEIRTGIIDDRDENKGWLNIAIDL